MDTKVKETTILFVFVLLLKKGVISKFVFETFNPDEEEW